MISNETVRRLQRPRHDPDRLDLPDLQGNREELEQARDFAFTPVELRVLRLTAAGYTHKEIAALMRCAEVTVTKYRMQIMRKLRAKNAPHMVARAYEEHVLELAGSTGPRREFVIDGLRYMLQP